MLFAHSLLGPHLFDFLCVDKEKFKCALECTRLYYRFAPNMFLFLKYERYRLDVQIEEKNIGNVVYITFTQTKYYYSLFNFDIISNYV